MNTGKRIPFFTLMICMLLSACAPRPVIYKSEWQNGGNGIQRRINSPMNFSDTKTKLNYTISNDSNNLYVFISCKSKATVSGIVIRGFQLWIDTTGKKRRQAGIICPLPLKNAYASEKNERRGGYSQGSSSDTSETKKLHQVFEEGARQMHISGFKNVLDGMQPLSNLNGINLSVALGDSNEFLYKAAIPLSEFLHAPLQRSDTSKVIGLLFSFTMNTAVQNNGGNGFMPAVGFGGFGFGGMGMMYFAGGNGGGGSSSSRESENIWTPFKLSLR